MSVISSASSGEFQGSAQNHAAKRTANVSDQKSPDEGGPLQAAISWLSSPAAEPLILTPALFIILGRRILRPIGVSPSQIAVVLSSIMR